MNLDRERMKSILGEVDEFKKKDYSFSSGRILGSMCTDPHPIAKKAYLKFLDTNLGDPGLFPGSKEMENKVIEFTSKLLHLPREGIGHVVSGGTEGNITAIWIAKTLSKRREVIIPKNAHFSFQKIASLMDLKLVAADLTSEYTINPSTVKKLITPNTAAVVGVAGSTDLGVIDSIPELSEICLDEQVFLHVDAAFGGFVIPFLKQLGYNVPEFDFSLGGVSSLSIDYHKMGYSTIPLGILLIRSREWLENISVEATCITTRKQSGLLGTRPGGPIAAAYAVTRYLGYKGYREVVKQCMETTRYLEEKLTTLGLTLVIKPIMNIIGVRFKNPSRVIEGLYRRGWRVSEITNLSSIRIVVMPHVTKKVIDEFIPNLEEACIEAEEI